MSNPPQQPRVYSPPGDPADPVTAPMNTATPAPGPYRDEQYVADTRPAPAAYWRLEGLRTGLTIVGLLALIAIGLAVWALLRSEHNRQVTSRASATPAAVASLTNRVDRLQATVHSLGSSGGAGTASTRSLAARISALQQTEQQLSSRINHSGSTAQVSQLASKESALSGKVSQLTGKEAAVSGQVSGLQGRVAQLAGQVSQLKAQSSKQTTTNGTTTTP